MVARKRREIMPDNTAFQLSQGYDVLQPKSGKAYPILCEEWNYLKEKIKSIAYNINYFLEIGVALVTISISTFITIITGAIQQPTETKPHIEIIAWSVVIIALVCGIAFLLFAIEKEKIKKVHASDIVSQMELIEKRFSQTEN
jgi:uncharacterized BrkB/YihY/UPF0761 family membrane protein